MHHPLTLRLLYERMAAVAGVLDAAVALGDDVDAMAEETAQVADPLVEDPAAGIGIGVVAKQQRMAAAHAGIFGVPVSPADFLVGVVAEEAGQGMTDPHLALVILEYRLTASRAGAAVGHECFVVDRMAPGQTEQLAQHVTCPLAIEGAGRAQTGSRAAVAGMADAEASADGCRSGYRDEQGAGLHPAPLGSFLKSELVRYGRVK